MSAGPEEVPRIENPAWFGQPFPSEGKLADKLQDIAAKVGDWTAKGADFADVLSLPGPLDAIGGVATGMNQFSESTVQNKGLRAVEAVIAGVLDVGMGMTPLGPILPAADSAASMIFGVSPGDLINNGLRAGFTAAEGAITGNRQGMETLQAKNIAGDYGKAMQKIVGG
jgi:hypothetical protein